MVVLLYVFQWFTCFCFGCQLVGILSVLYCPFMCASFCSWVDDLCAELWPFVTFFVVVLQALALLEHLVKNGAERVIEDARDHLHRVRMLSDFNYYEGSLDKGTGGEHK